MSDSPFGRQPKPVKVTIEGEEPEVSFWLRRLGRAAEYKGDATTFNPPNAFTIYPRAVND